MKPARNGVDNIRRSRHGELLGGILDRNIYLLNHVRSLREVNG